MNKKKAEKIVSVYNWIRLALFILLLALLCVGAAKNAQGDATNLLAMTDSERHRMTLGTTFSLRNPYFPTDIRLNYEKYWYPHGGAKDSEQDKLVCELMIRF